MTARSDPPFDPAVVRPWRIGDGSRGALLLHGFAGTPPELRHLGETLAAAGWRCHGPLLAGHGTTPEALARTRWTDWAGSARAELEALRARCAGVAVVGQSAGAAIALHLAATDPGISAVACLAAPVRLPGLGPRLLPAARHVYRWNRPGGEVDLYRPEGIDELRSYARRPTRSIAELVRMLDHVRADLVSVRAPVLLLHGERDRVIDPDNAAEIERRLLCSAAVRRVMLPRSGHGISVDVDRERVERDVLAWLDLYSPAAPERPAAGAARPRR